MPQYCIPPPAFALPPLCSSTHSPLQSPPPHCPQSTPTPPPQKPLSHSPTSLSSPCVLHPPPSHPPITPPAASPLPSQKTAPPSLPYSQMLSGVPSYAPCVLMSPHSSSPFAVPVRPPLPAEIPFSHKKKPLPPKLTDAFMILSMCADVPHLLATTTAGVDARRLLSFTLDT